MPGLARDHQPAHGVGQQRVVRVQVQHEYQFLFNALGVRGGKVYLVDDRDYAQPSFRRQVSVCDGLGFDALRRIDEQEGSVPAAEGGDLAYGQDRAGDVRGVEHADQPRAALDEIRALLPGTEAPTVMPLEGLDDKVAVHAVCRENVFWETLESLKQAGASSMLVLPVEKMLS